MGDLLSYPFLIDDLNPFVLSFLTFLGSCFRTRNTMMGRQERRRQASDLTKWVTSLVIDLDTLAPFSKRRVSNSFLDTESFPVRANTRPSRRPEDLEDEEESTVTADFFPFLGCPRAVPPPIRERTQSSSITIIPLASASRHFLVSVAELEKKIRSDRNHDGHLTSPSECISL
jgi:hypothetical protein